MTQGAMAHSFVIRHLEGMSALARLLQFLMSLIYTESMQMLSHSRGMPMALQQLAELANLLPSNAYGLCNHC